MFFSQGVNSLRKICDDVYFMGNGSCSWLLVSCDHDDLDASLAALGDRAGNSEPRRVVERNEADESEAVHGEVAGD